MAKTGSSLPTNLVRDASRIPISSAGSFVVADASASPKTSPLSVSSSAITITVPDNAIEFVVNPSVAMRISSESSLSTYDVVAANTKEVIPCAKMQNIYLIRDSSDLTLNFRFTIL